jgi:hypothetical protein
MKTPIILLSFLLFLHLSAIAQVKVKGYYRKDGTYVQPHYRSSPDGNPYNNYSYPGNINPYTGKIATGNPSTYLSNYYKTYSNRHSEATYHNYSALLLYTNYQTSKSKMQHTYDIHQQGRKVGTISYNAGRVYNILDSDGKHIGYVEYSRRMKKYTVYDLYSSLPVSTNKRQIDPSGAWVVVGLGLTVLLFSLDSNSN